ncbi:MAG: nucleoside hydrolase [Clostridiales bacterium]|nr:nucleoside hydrolase [Clostridiales bacterium]
METIPLILDCDTGVDDALALLVALLHPKAKLLGVTSVHGNIPVQKAAENNLSILKLFHREDIPVAVGSALPLAGENHFAFQVHGKDGLGETYLSPGSLSPIDEPAALFIARLAREHPGEITLVATGPLTNVALAFLLEPELPRLLRRVVVMGGAVTVPGNVTPLAEANIFNDPEAARRVLNAGFPLTLIGLDVTMKTLFGPKEMARLKNLAAEKPALQFIHRALAFYTDFYTPILGTAACPLHDPLALAAALDPSLVNCQPMSLYVETAPGQARGATLADRRHGRAKAFTSPPVDVALEVKAEDAVEFIFSALERARSQ